VQWPATALTKNVELTRYRKPCRSLQASARLLLTTLIPVGQIEATPGLVTLGASGLKSVAVPVVDSTPSGSGRPSPSLGPPTKILGAWVRDTSYVET